MRRIRLRISFNTLLEKWSPFKDIHTDDNISLANLVACHYDAVRMKKLIIKVVPYGESIPTEYT